MIGGLKLKRRFFRPLCSYIVSIIFNFVCFGVNHVSFSSCGVGPEGRRKRGMPLGKYECDYCDKQFQDTPYHRKRHLQGLQHQKAKALWYASIPPDPNQVSLQPPTVGLCNRFIRTGSCPYGDSCKYIHPNQNLQNMNMQGFAGGMVVDKMGVNLPPSLRPPPEGGYPSLPFVNWG